MAKIKITMTNFSPNIVSTATVTQASRSGTNVKLNVSIATNLRYSSSSLGSGYTITGRVTARGTNKDVTLKSSSASWSGTTTHTSNTTMSITVPATETSITIGYRLSVSGYESATATGTNTTLTLSKVLATTTAVTGFTDTTNPSVTFSNPSNFKLRPFITLYTSETSGVKIGTTFYPLDVPSPETLSSPYVWDLNETQRNTLRDWMGSRTSAYAQIGINTYDGSTYIGGSYKGATFTNVLEPPTFTDFAYQDINSATTAITSDSSKIILGYSTLQITISGNNKATANKGATMSYYLVNGVQYAYSDSVVITLEKWNSSTIEVTAVDSRGISTKVTKQLTIASYEPLVKGEIDVTRDGNINESTTLTYNGIMTKTLPNGNQNTLSASYRYKKTNEENYTTGLTNITSGIQIDNDGNFDFEGLIRGDKQTGFDINYSYNIIVEVSDALTTIQYSDTINSGIPAIAIKENNVSIHGVYDETLGGTQLNGEVYLNGVDISGVLSAPVVLFESSGASSGTLTENITQFKKIVIQTVAGNGIMASSTILKDDTTNSILTSILCGSTVGTTYYGSNARISITNKALTVDRIGEFSIRNNNTSVVTTTTNSILVTKIVGYYEY